MAEWTFCLQRHQGETTLLLVEVPLRWLIVERLASPLLGRRLTDGIANWLFLQADRRHRLLEEITLDDEAVDAIDPDWNRLWGDDDD